ncbi:MAG: hypothetical protein R2755_03260 [Acidimicrobiales bacterium]
MRTPELVIALGNSTEQRIPGRNIDEFRLWERKLTPVEDAPGSEIPGGEDLRKGRSLIGAKYIIRGYRFPVKRRERS